MNRKRLPRLLRIAGEWTVPSPLLQSRKIVLSALAKDGPSNTYQIAKKTGKTYSLTFNSVKELVERKMVRFEGKKRTIKGTMANVYDLTLRGVLFVLGQEFAAADTDKRNYGAIRKIIHKYASLLPLVFGKWDYFDRNGVGEMALCRLKAVVVDQDAFEPEYSWIPGKSMEEKIYWFFYFAGFLSFPQSPAVYEGWCGMEAPQKWMNAWVQDGEIKAFVVKEIEAYQRRLKDFGAYVESHMTIIVGNKRHRKT